MSITFTIIKPDAVAAGYSGLIIDQITKAGFSIIALKLIHISRQQAERFYAVHKGRPFYAELTTFMCSKPIYVAVLSKENAVLDFRKLIGATDPAKAAEGTIRKRFAKSVGENAIHGSDSDENAQLESQFFFSSLEMISP